MEAIGVDIGGTNLRVARVAMDGTVAAASSARTNGHADDAIKSMVALAREVDGPTVTGIGIGAPGRVDTRTRQVLSGGFLDLSKVDLPSVIETALGKPVVVDTDANFALVAEWRYGAARRASNVAMLTIGTGIGGAAMVDGRVLRGRRSGGQFGHLTVDHIGLLCACGRRGCVETTSSGTALRRLIVEADMPTGTCVEGLLAAAGNGDVAARKLLACWATPLRSAIDSIIAALDPERIVLGGGLGGAAARALQYAPALSSWYQAPVVTAELGDRAGVIGAAWAAAHSDCRP